MARSAAGVEDNCKALSIYEPSQYTRRVFVKTSLGTNLLVLIDPQQTISDLQREIAEAHVQRFTDRGRVLCSGVSVLSGADAFAVPSEYLIHDVLSADDAQLVSATCSVLAEPGKEVEALPAPQPADGGAALTVASEEQADVGASHRAPAPETGTAARGSGDAPAGEADAEHSGDEDEDDDEDNDDGDEDDEEETGAGVNGRVSGAAPEQPATAGGHRSEEEAAEQVVNGRGAAPLKPAAAATAAESSSSEDEDDDDDDDDEVEADVAAAEGQHAAAAATDGPRNGMQSASREPGPAPALSSDGDDSSDDDDTSGSDDDGSRPRAATNGVQRQSARASQRGSDAAHESYGAVSGPPAGRAASAKRRVRTAELQAPVEPEKVRQISPQPPDFTSKLGSAAAKPRPYSTAAPPARFTASRAGEETEIVSGSGSSEPESGDEDEDEDDEQQGAVPTTNGHAAGVVSGSDSSEESDEESDEESEQHDGANDVVPDSERDGGPGPAQPAAPQSSRPTVAAENGRRDAGGNAAGTADGHEGVDGGDADWQRAAQTRNNPPAPSLSSSELDDDEDEETEAGDNTEPPAVVPATQHSQQAGSVEATRVQDEATEPPLSVAKQQLQQRKRRAPEPSSTAETEPAMAARQRRKRRAVPASSSDEDDADEDAAEDEPEPTPTRKRRKRSVTTPSVVQEDAADHRAVASGGRRHKQPAVSDGRRRHAAPQSSSSEEDHEQQEGQLAAVAERRSVQAVPPTSSSSEDEEEEREDAEAGDSGDNGGGTPAPAPFKRAEKQAPASAQHVDSRPSGKKGAKRAAIEPADTGHGKKGLKRSRKAAAADDAVVEDDERAGAAAASEAAAGGSQPRDGRNADRATATSADELGVRADDVPPDGATGVPAGDPYPATSEQRHDEHPPAASLSKAERKALRKRLRESRGSLGGGGDAHDSPAGHDPSALRGLDGTGTGKKKKKKAAAAEGTEAEPLAAHENGGAAVNTPAVDGDGSQPLSAKQARRLKQLARQPDALAGLLQATTKKSAPGAKAARQLGVAEQQQQSQPQGPQPATPDRDAGGQRAAPEEGAAADNSGQQARAPKKTAAEPAGNVAADDPLLKADRRPAVLSNAQRVADLVSRPLSDFDAKELIKVVREAVREAVNEERAVRGLKPSSGPKLYKDNPRPAWWPLPTFDAKELKTRAAMNAVYGALQSRFGELPV